MNLRKKYARVDLTAHGPIGFQPYWLRTQGYAGKSLIKLFTDNSARRDIDICAVVSQADDMNAPYQDRFAHLRSELLIAPPGYSVEIIGNNAFSVQQGIKNRNRHCVTFLNAQSVVMQEDGEKLSLTVIGTNRAPNGKTHRETMKWCADHPEF